MDENENPLQQVMNMATSLASVQHNSATLRIKWKYHQHEFEVESMNPIQAFALMDKVKEVAKQKLKKEITS